jgi:hypothetical protein
MWKYNFYVGGDVVIAPDCYIGKIMFIPLL